MQGTRISRRTVASLRISRPGFSPYKRGLMRMPLGGGDAQVVLSLDESFDVQCSSRPGSACVLIRRRHDAEVVSLLDPIKGVETEVVKTGSDDRNATISPDGQQIGFLLTGKSGQPNPCRRSARGYAKTCDCGGHRVSRITRLGCCRVWLLHIGLSSVNIDDCFTSV